MHRLCENLHEDVHDFMPLTFVVDIGSLGSQQEFDKFTTYFNLVDKHKKSQDEPGKALEVINKHIATHPNLVEKRRCYRTITLRDSMYDGQNMWLLKPSDYNRGRGVSLFNSVETLKRLIHEMMKRQPPDFNREQQSGGTA
jgi:hypothetical protein